MNPSQFFQANTFPTFVQVFLPGAVAASPWMVFAYDRFRPSARLETWEGVVVALAAIAVIAMFGALAYELGAMLEAKLDRRVSIRRAKRKLTSYTKDPDAFDADGVPKTKPVQKKFEEWRVEWEASKRGKLLQFDKAWLESLKKEAREEFDDNWNRYLQKEVGGEVIAIGYLKTQVLWLRAERALIIALGFCFLGVAVLGLTDRLGWWPGGSMLLTVIAVLLAVFLKFFRDTQDVCYRTRELIVPVSTKSAALEPGEEDPSQSELSWRGRGRGKVLK